MNNYKNNIADNFTTLPNYIVNDPSISWKAKGILIYLASKPNDWNFFMTEIQKNATDGKDGLKSGIKELTESGYLIRTRSQKEDGTFFGYDWQLVEPEGRKERQTEKPADGKTGSRKTPSHSNTNNTNTNNTKKEDTKEKEIIKEKAEQVSLVLETEQPSNLQISIAEFVKDESLRNQLSDAPSKMRGFMESNFPNVEKLQTKITYKQANELIKEFGAQQFLDVLLSMENYKPLKSKYTNAYLTALNWLKRDAQKSSSQAEQNATRLIQSHRQQQQQPSKNYDLTK